MPMSNLLRRLARACGLKTWYLVTATYPIGGGYGTVTCTCSVAPWLHIDNYPDLLAYVKTQASSSAATPNIIGVTRLGF